MKEINGEILISKEEMKHELVNFIKEEDNMFKEDVMMSLMAGAIALEFIKFVFKEGDEDENNE